MREIKFRGIRVDNGEWVWGDLVKLYYPNATHIAQETDNQHWSNTRFTEVLPESVGQFTGLKDKNGLTDIYEGDIIDKTGTKKGNVYESPEVYKAGFDIIIERMGTEDGGDSIKEANNRGCKYAERPGIQNSFWQLVKRTEGGRTNTKEISN